MMGAFGATAGYLIGSVLAAAAKRTAGFQSAFIACVVLAGIG